MAQLLYFVDNQHRVTRDQARELGMAHVFPDSHFVCSEYSGAGPGGNTGCVVGRSDERLGYYADRQTWLKMPPVPGRPQEQHVHVGLWNDARPTPAELLVAEPLRGTTLRLGDGNDWLIPVARSWNDRGDQAGWYNPLPGKLALNSNGAWSTGQVESRYAHLWELGTKWWEAMLGRDPDATGTIRFDFAGANDAALAVLATNYRLSAAELVLLELFDDQLVTASEVLNALIDWSTFIAWAKKKLIAPPTGGSSSPGGEQAATATTVPPLSTSGPSSTSKRSRSRRE